MGVFLEIRTVWRKHIIKTTQKEFDRIQFELETVPKAFYPTLTREGIEEHRKKILIKKLGLRVQDVKVTKIDEDYLKVLISTGLIKEYDVTFSLKRFFTKSIAICNALSRPFPAGVGQKRILLVPNNKLLKVACANGIDADKLDAYLLKIIKEA